MTAAPARTTAILLRRELGLPLLAALLATSAAAVVVAQLASTGIETRASLFDRMLRRFDLTTLYLAAAAGVFLVGVRVEDDERALWLDCFMAAGASRVLYALAVAGGAFALAASPFVAAATTYAASAYAFSGSPELLVDLPVTLGAGLLMLLHWCAWMTLFATLLRRALPAFTLACLGVLLPFGLLTLQLQRAGSVDTWLLWLVRLSPPLVPPADPWLAAIQLAAAGALMAIVGVSAASFIGRHA